LQGGALNFVHALQGANAAGEIFNNTINQITTSFSNILGEAMSVGRTISSMASGASTVAMGISSVVNAFETF
jgi:hypothetical protein